MVELDPNQSQTNIQPVKPLSLRMKVGVVKLDKEELGFVYIPTHVMEGLESLTGVQHSEDEP